MILVGVALAGAACAWLAGGRPSRRWPGDGDGDGDGADVSVIVPARDEAAALPVLLDSIAASTVRPMEVVVVDDGSTDDTAEVARSGGALVIDPGEPPAGWTGKTWACARGADLARGEVLLFLDADVRLGPRAIGACLALHRRTGGLVSVQPHHTVGRPVEHLSALFNAVAVLGAGACSPVAAWRRDAAVAYGPCMVVSRADYERSGGHAAVRASVAEDLALAARARSVGVGTTAVTGADLVSYRMYPDGFGALVDGWTKNMATGATVASRPAVLLTVTWVASLAAVAAGTALAVAGGGAVWPAVVAYGISAASVRWATARVGTFSPSVAAAFPAALAVFVAVFARSGVRLALGRPVRWRGRDVPLGRAEGGSGGAGDAAARPVR